MGETLIYVNGMSCAHCVGAVKRALESLPEVRKVEVDLSSGRVSITGDVSREQLKITIEEAGYGVKE